MGLKGSKMRRSRGRNGGGQAEFNDVTTNDIALAEKQNLSDEGVELANDVTHANGKEVALGNGSGYDGRETWDKKADFLLSVIGFAVDLGNVWRFPYYCYKNGGGAFLIPYTLILLLGGIPLFYMELALGQFNRKGAITCWGRICPLFRGVGYAVVLIAFYTDFYYNVVIAWALHYFISSFTSRLPWISCNNTWNTPDCFDGYLTGDEGGNDTWGGNGSSWANGSLAAGAGAAYSAARGGGEVLVDAISAVTSATGLNASNVTAAIEDTRKSPALEYYERGMLGMHESTGIDGLGQIRWQMALCLLAVYVICYFSLWKGVHTSGKVVWFTALFPYVVLLILLVRGTTLSGAAIGINYYITPDFSRLASSEVWTDAATQVFFSLGPGFGVLLAFASYNKFHNNVYYDAIATSLINCLTSFLAGFVIFAVLGYMAEKTGKDISKVATEGPGLVFVVYPEAIATLPASTFWSLIFFMMLLTLGLDSSFGGSEAIITALGDEYPWIKKNREIFVGILFVFYYIVGLASCTEGGAYVVQLLDTYAAGYSILMAVFFESIAIGWLYGVDRFADDIHSMLGFRPGIYWRLCWKFFAPISLLAVVIFGFSSYQPLTLDKYIFPTWSNVMGWCVALSSILCIPGFAVYQLVRAKGTFRERLTLLTTPWRDTQKAIVDGKVEAELGSPGEPV